MTAEGAGAPTPECDCDYWHSKHRWHCATNRISGPEVERVEHSPGETCTEADERAADNWQHAESAGAALDAARRESDAMAGALADQTHDLADLRGRLAAAWEVAATWERDNEEHLNRVGQHLMGGAVLSCAEHLRAALANPSAAQ